MRHKDSEESEYVGEEKFTHPNESNIIFLKVPSSHWQDPMYEWATDDSLR